MPSTMVRSFVVATAFLILATFALAQRNSPAPTATQPDKGREVRSAIELRLSTSRQTAAMGSAFQVEADITNLSRNDVFLNPRYLTLIIPPEIDPYGPRAWLPLLPGCEPKPEGAIKTDAGGTRNVPLTVEERYDCMTRLSPGSHITAMWSANKPALEGEANEAPGVWDHIWNSPTMIRRRAETSFTPGTYTFTVVAHYWQPAAVNAQQTVPDVAPVPQSDLQTARIETAEILVPVSVPIITIVFGAFLGGLLIALLYIVPHADGPKTWKKVLWLVFRTAVMGSVFAILLQRLGGTALPISITVNDFLGAICIGFIGGLSGESLLVSILTGLAKKREELAVAESKAADSRKDATVVAKETKPAPQAAIASAGTKV